MKYILVFISFLFVSAQIAAQTDFAIPDAPAFAIIQQKPTAILRASSSKEMMVNIGSAILSESLNQNPWGIEYSFVKRLKIPIALSYATNLSPIRSVSFGIRWDPINEITAEKDKVFQQVINDLISSSNNINEQAEKILAIKYDTTIMAVSIQHEVELRDLATQLAKADENFNILTMTAKDKTEKLLWRKEILSFAIASRFSSKDVTYDKLSVNDMRIQAWGVYTYEIGKMIQLNCNLTALHETKNGIDTTSGGFSIRGYYGSNNFKMLLDASMIATNKNKKFLEFSLGSEWNFIDNYWLMGRFLYNASTDKVVPTIDIKVGI